MFDPNDLDLMKRKYLEGDGKPINITAYQAQKCAAILEAYSDGQTLYREHIDTVAQFLKAAAIQGSLGSGYSRPSTQVFWQRLNELSWPLHGGPRAQAD